jgi:hypothetical protein
MSETKEGPNPWGQTGVIWSSGVSGIFEAPEHPDFYRAVDRLTWKAENDKIWLVGQGPKDTYLLDGYAPIKEQYEELNRRVDFRRDRGWATWVPKAPPDASAICRKNP